MTFGNIKATAIVCDYRVKQFERHDKKVLQIWRKGKHFLDFAIEYFPNTRTYKLLDFREREFIIEDEKIPFPTLEELEKFFLKLL